MTLAALAVKPLSPMPPAAIAVGGISGFPEPPAASKRHLTPPTLALYHSLDARRVIKRRLRRRQGHQREALEQKALLQAMQVQLAAVEAQQRALADRVAKEQAACQQLVALVATVQSALPDSVASTADSGQYAAQLAAQLGQLHPPPQPLLS